MFDSDTDEPIVSVTGPAMYARKFKSECEAKPAVCLQMQPSLVLVLPAPRSACPLVDLQLPS